jgi:hypothetical protein
MKLHIFIRDGTNINQPDLKTRYLYRTDRSNRLPKAVVHLVQELRTVQDTSDLAKCHKAVLRQNVIVLKHRIVFVLCVFVLDYIEIYSFFKH